MKAFIRTQYGGPEILRLEDVEKPSPKVNEVLVKVVANSANPADWHLLRGEPFFARFAVGLFTPKDKIPGADFAGVVAGVGGKVTQFKVGDKVFGETLLGGAFAEYLCAPQSSCALMLEGADFATMASVPIAGLTALQALVTLGRIQKEESVLINGSSGGVGHFAVQIAKAHGANVTGVCSRRNVEFVRSLGADHVIAYDSEPIHHHNKVYDLVVDTHGNLSYRDFTRMGRRGVVTGFTTVGHMISLLAQKSFGKLSLVQVSAEANTKDLDTLARLVHDRKIVPHIEKTYSFTEIPEAIRYIEAMRTRGKVVMVWMQKG